jgi:hypothetical protein
MKKLLLVLAVAVVAAVTLAGAASAGGWATVGLSSLPGGTPAGGKWSVDMTVLQHGRTPLEGIAPILTIRNGDGETRDFVGTPTGKPGVYHADVVFPDEGTWSYSVWDDFSRTHTFKPVEISAPGDAFPIFELGLASVLALGLAGATVLLLRRRRPEPQPIQLKEAA